MPHGVVDFDTLKLLREMRFDGPSPPVWLSGDPEHPGALEFSRSLGYSIEIELPGKGIPTYVWKAPGHGGSPLYDGKYSTAAALIAAVHAHWKAQQPNASEPASGRSNVG